MELFRAFDERARRLAEKARQAAQDAGLQEKVDAVAARIEAVRDRVVPASVRERVEAARDAVQEGADGAAVALAAKITELRGVETTPEQVKRVAARIGVALLAAGAAHLIADALSADGDAGPGHAGHDGHATPEGGSNDPVSDVRMGLARHGHSINVETTVVDGDGCVLDGPG